MPLDPQIERMLATLEAHGHRGMAAGTPEEGRASFRLLTVDLRRPETIVPVRAMRASCLKAEMFASPNISGSAVSKVRRLSWSVS